MNEDINIRKRLIDAGIRDAKISLPCIVTGFTQDGDNEPFVNVRIAIDYHQEIEERQNQRQEWIDIDEVPIAYASSSKGAITLPIAAGDSGYLWFSDRDLDEWNFEDAPTTAQARRRTRNINDAVYFPGVWKRIKGLADYNQDAVEVRSVSGKARVIVSDDVIHLNAETIKMNGIDILSVNPAVGVALPPGGTAVAVKRP